MRPGGRNASAPGAGAGTQLQAQVPAWLAKWEPVVGAQAAAWRLKQLRTPWGTCSIRARRIWLSVELS